MTLRLELEVPSLDTLIEPTLVLGRRGLSTPSRRSRRGGVTSETTLLRIGGLGVRGEELLGCNFDGADIFRDLPVRFESIEST